MADIPDYMRGFDLDQDYGFTPVSSKPTESKPAVDPKLVENSNIEISKINSIAEFGGIATPFAKKKSLPPFAILTSTKIVDDTMLQHLIPITAS